MRTRPARNVRYGSLPVAVLVAVALAGCGGSSAGSSAGASGAGTSAGGSGSTAPGPVSSSSAASGGSADSGGAAAGSVPNPCTLVTRKDATGIMGVDAGAPIHAPVDIADTCTYHSHGMLVSIVVRKIGKAQFDASATTTADAKAVSGIGSDVYQVGDTLEFWKSGLQVAVGYQAGPGSSSLSKEKTVAQAVMARL